MGQSRPNTLVSVIIVSYNTREMTLRCLDDVYHELQGIESEVWVVDNASKDGSLDAIKERFPQTNAVANPRNAGFGAANNLAMKQASGEFFLLVNSDAFLKPGSVRAMLDCANRYPKAAVIGPRLLNGDGTLQISCYKFPSPVRAWLENLWLSSIFSGHPALGDYRHWAHDKETEVDSVTGACMMVRRSAYVESGGFDERYFMYQEETDWQKTLRERGWDVVFTPSAEVTHLGGASGKDDVDRISGHFFESLDIYEHKHHGVLGLISVRGAMVIGCMARAIAWFFVMCLIPRKRKSAAAKTRLHCKLVFRQATNWKTALKGSS